MKNIPTLPHFDIYPIQEQKESCRMDDKLGICVFCLSLKQKLCEKKLERINTPIEHIEGISDFGFPDFKHCFKKKSIYTKVKHM